MAGRPILISTVGTSLFRPNLEGLRPKLQDANLDEHLRQLGLAYVQQNWQKVAQALLTISPSDRICGAEINSIANMIEHGYVSRDCGLYFLHSETEDGQHIGEVLVHYFRSSGHKPVEAVCVHDLQDEDPKRFRTQGLRNLARRICAIIREHSAKACAINATGGYKAQIAIAVLLGQAIGVPVYYMHERFSEIISFPPMPISLDFELWMQASGMLYTLESSTEPFPAKLYEDEWDERYESLVERENIDGQQYLTLSPTGQIFHETFNERFRTARDMVLPPRAVRKETPRLELEQAGWPGKHPEVEQFLTKVTQENSPVIRCSTFYYNPDLPERTRFVPSRGEVVGIYSNGSYTVKFRVESTAETEGQKKALVALLNHWLFERS